jgi:acetoacetyl-CoA reductase
MTARVALVTGGTGGIGTAIVQRLADLGHTVATNYRNEDKAAAWRDNVGAAGYDVTLVKGDVSSAEQAETLVREIEKQTGPIDILVNNAGITRDTTFHKMRPDQWNDVIDTNLNSVYNMTRPVIEGMRERKWGRIVQISSINGQKGQYGQANYAAAKAGLIGLTKTVSHEVARRGITVNAVAPGFIETDMTKDMLDDVVKAIPARRAGQPEEVAAAVRFLASDDAAYVTGTTLFVDGGMSA